MSNGFGGASENSANITINIDEVNTLIKKYKKIKKYMKSNIFQVKTMEGTETYVSGLIKEAEENPPDI